jgi:hypothetical protein
MRITVGLIGLLGLGITTAAGGCSSSSGPIQGAGGDSGATITPTDNDYCKACTRSPDATPKSCNDQRPVDACCTCVKAPTQEVARGINLVRNSSSDPTVDLKCLKDPGKLETPKNVKLKGFVRLFSGGLDSKGVKIEIYKEGKDGALGELVGQPYETTDNDQPQMPLVTYLEKCPTDGCKFREYAYDGVPTETPLIVKTSDSKASGQWSELYDYNIVFRNSQPAEADGSLRYDPAVVAATDVNTVAQAAGGFSVKPGMGVIAGEVHDCGDVRLSGAMVDTDIAHEGPMFYFTDKEADPLPDQTRSASGLGTSKLGLFGALNFKAGVPIKISAVGKYQGETVLLGTYTVQVFPGAVTALSFRGRRPWQQQ